jgi:hypothetical protein
MAERDKKGRFVAFAGNGRPLGSGNKFTQQIKDMVKLIVHHNLENLQNDLDFMDPEDRVKAVAGLMKYVIPNQTPTLGIDTGGGGISINIGVGDKLNELTEDVAHTIITPREDGTGTDLEEAEL